MKRTVFVCAIFCLASCARAQDTGALRDAILRCAAEQGVRVGVAARHLGTGAGVEINADYIAGSQLRFQPAEVSSATVRLELKPLISTLTGLPTAAVTARMSSSDDSPGA